MSAECGPPPVLPHVSLISWTFIQSRLEVHICCYRAETEGDEMPHTDTEVCVKPSKMHFWFIDAEKSILFKFSFNLNQVCSWLGQTTCLIIVTFHPSYLHITHVHDCYRMDWLGYMDICNQKHVLKTHEGSQLKVDQGTCLPHGADCQNCPSNISWPRSSGGVSSVPQPWGGGGSSRGVWGWGASAAADLQQRGCERWKSATGRGG